MYISSSTYILLYSSSGAQNTGGLALASLLLLPQQYISGRVGANNCISINSACRAQDLFTVRSILVAIVRTHVTCRIAAVIEAQWLSLVLWSWSDVLCHQKKLYKKMNRPLIFLCWHMFSSVQSLVGTWQQPRSLSQKFIRHVSCNTLVSELVKPSCSSILFSQNMAASKGSSMSSRTGVFIQLTPYLVAKFKILNFFWHLYAELNLDEIKNALHNLPINRETNLMNLIMP